jgi:hypothetical protein
LNLISFILSFFLSINAFGALTLDEERKYDELEGTSFLKALIQDKKYTEVLEQFPHLKLKLGEEGKSWYFRALAEFEMKKYKEARASLIKAEKFKTPSDFYALWGRTEAKLRDFSSCKKKFRKFGIDLIEGKDWEVYFSCLLSVNPNEALTLAMDESFKKPDFILESQGLLLSYELLELGKSRRDSYLENCQSVEFYLRLWEILEKKKVTDFSVLERAHFCHSNALEITSHLVKALFSEGQYHSIAHLFESLSAEDGAYLKHTAEFYKVAGRNTVANYFFGLGKEEDYLLHWSSHFLNQENYAGLLSIPFRPDLLVENKDLSYAIAYSHFKYVSLEGAKSILSQLPKKNGRDQQLEALIQECRKLDWRCRP